MAFYDEMNTQLTQGDRPFIEIPRPNKNTLSSTINYHIKMKYLMLIAIIALSSCALPTRVAVNPKGEFASIEVEPSNREMKLLSKRDPASIERVTKNPGGYNPAVLYALSDALFRSGRKDDAAYWYYLGQLRARSDANKALDFSARQAVGVLNQRYGSQINRYTFKDTARLRLTVSKVILSDQSIPRDYDARWIALHGMDAFDSDKVDFAPRNQWKTINDTTRRQYEKDFNSAMRYIQK